MVVTSGIERAIQYYQAMKDYLASAKAPIRPSWLFRVSTEFDGSKVSEASLNGFPSNDIAEKIQNDPYRFLICADKFQTGYDEPLLHTMYVDKTAGGHQSGADSVSAQSRPSAETRLFCPRFPEQQRSDQLCLRRLLPHNSC